MKLTVQCPHCKRAARVAHSTTKYFPSQKIKVGPRGSSKRFSDGINHNTFRPWKPLEQKTEEKEAYFQITYILECALTTKEFGPYSSNGRGSQLPTESGHQYGTFDSRHKIIETVLQSEIKDFDSIDKKKSAWDFQRDGIEFAARTGWRCLIADDMALGKTVQAALCVKNAKQYPVLIAVKQSTTYNWLREMSEWTTDDFLDIQVISGGKRIIPCSQIYIISMDLMGRKGMVEKLLPLGFKMIIADESHSFKEPGAARTKALIRLCKEGNIQHRIFLSGTPIKNRADEYFTVLNLIDPINFPSLANFSVRWLDADGKRIRPYLLDQFHNVISKYVIRRRKSEVLRDLPDKVISPIFYEIEDEYMKASYNAELDLLSNYVRDCQNPYSPTKKGSLLGWLASIRAITGRAKSPRILEMVQQFLDEVEDEKLAIGIHHKDVRDYLKLTLETKGINALTLSGEDSASEKDRIVRHFARPENRVLIVNMIAGGIGLNLQMCSTTYLAERPWSYADEMQYIDRYHRPGQKNTVNADIIIAKGTIDEWFHELIEEKKQIFGSIVDGGNFEFTSGDMQKLVEKTLSHRL